MDDILTKSQAVTYLGLDIKVFENYFRFAKEFKPQNREGDKGRFFFKKAELDEWKKSYDWRSIKLDKDDYALCLDFALAMHFRGYVLSDWGTARQREFGQKLTNWIKGQLAEVAFQKFIKKNFGLTVDLDFEIHDQIVPQDIIAVEENGHKRDPKIGVGIKSSKPKSCFLVLGENEIRIAERRSDIYIFCRPDIPDDHILRLTKNAVIEVVKNQQHFSSYKDKMPDFEDMICEIAGWCNISELREVTSIPGQEFNGKRYVIESGLLHRTKSDWEALIKKI